MKNTIIAGVLLLIATFFVTVGVAEISFPETFLTFTDQDWLLNIWPKAYRYPDRPRDQDSKGFRDPRS